MRYALSLALIGFLFAAVPAHAFNTKAGYDQEGAPGAITPERIKSEAEEAAQKLQDSRPRRYYFYSTYARNATEFAALAKYTVYLFMVWTQKAEELPIKRIFIRAPRGQEIPALNVMSWRMPVEQGSATAKRFGPYRQDGFFLFPTGALLRDGQIIMDLTTGASEWVMVDLPSAVAAKRQGIFSNPDAAQGAKPNLKTLQDFVRREYPGFPVPTAIQ